jgi:hypothetical protein
MWPTDRPQMLWLNHNKWYYVGIIIIIIEPPPVISSSWRVRLCSFSAWLLGDRLGQFYQYGDGENVLFMTNWETML